MKGETMKKKRLFSFIAMILIATMVLSNTVLYANPTSDDKQNENAAEQVVILDENTDDTTPAAVDETKIGGGVLNQQMKQTL